MRPLTGSLAVEIQRRYGVHEKSTETSNRMLAKFVSIGTYSHEVRTFGTLITSTKVFSLIIC